MASEQQGRSDGDDGGEKVGLDREDESQSFVDQSKIDFDPDEGVYSGTAVDGTSEIPGPHLESESGELSPEDMQREAAQQAEEAGVSPEDTPAAKSPVAKAAEQDRGGGDREDG